MSIERDFDNVDIEHILSKIEEKLSEEEKTIRNLIMHKSERVENAILDLGWCDDDYFTFDDVIHVLKRIDNHEYSRRR